MVVINKDGYSPFKEESAYCFAHQGFDVNSFRASNSRDLLDLNYIELDQHSKHMIKHGNDKLT